MEAAEPSHLRLDRRKANLHFSSWRLSSSILRSEGTIALPLPAAPAQTADTDYVAARHAALLNRVTQQPGGCYVFLEEPTAPPAGPQLALYHLDVGESGTAPQLHRVQALPEAQPEDLIGGLTAASLPASVAEVQTAPRGSDAQTSRQLLVSSGHGDITLVRWPLPGQQQPGDVAASVPVFPLRPAPPLQGVRPLHLLASYQLPRAAQPEGSADICCILWSPRPRSQRQASRCEVYAVRLAARLAPGGPPALQVAAVQPLRVSDLPPHGVLVNPATGGVLLALQPTAAGVEEEAADQRAAAAVAAERPAGRGSASSDDDVSPRTLQAAVARLAAFTSEEPVGPLPHQQYADLYRESGADGIGAMGSEPACALYVFEPAQAAAADLPGSSDRAEGPATTEAGTLLRAAGSLSCQPHKLLTCHLEQRGAGAQEPATPDTHLPQGGSSGGGGATCGPRLLLGLTDDVECAVVAVSCRAGADGSGSGSGGPAGFAGSSFAVEHETSLPAMAYVAAGKVQRKFLLLAPPGGDVAAVLAEGQQYAYLYRSVAPRQAYAEHQVLDMELPDSEQRGLLGAVLAGSRAGACRLALLAREGLRVVDM